MAATAKRKSKRTRVENRKPLVIITGATGNLGQSLGKALRAEYEIVGFDLRTDKSDFPIIGMDLTSGPAIELALRKLRESFGSNIASVIHLAAYFDFSGEDSALYDQVNVEGTRKLLRALRDFEVDQFICSSTILVHAPCRPGEHIDESQPVEPRWAYPRSKAAAEEVVRAEREKTPYVLLRLAGVYDEHVMVPTLSHQIARIFERDFQSHFYSGNTLVGALVLTVVSIAAAEVARPVRYFNVALGTALLIVPFVYEADASGTIASIISGAALIGLSFRRGAIRERYGDWNHLLV